MSNLICTILALVASVGSMEVREGWASQYESQKTVMDTVEARQGWDHLPTPLPDVDGYVAVADCKRIGEEVLLYREGVGLERFLVFDCSGHVETSRWMLDNNILVEVDRETAERWDIVGQGGIKIYEIGGIDGEIVQEGDLQRRLWLKLEAGHEAGGEQSSP